MYIMMKRDTKSTWRFIFTRLAGNEPYAALQDRVESLEAETEIIWRSLESFTVAINECTIQLRTHTRIIQDLVEVSRDLKMRAAEQSQSTIALSEAIRRFGIPSHR